MPDTATSTDPAVQAQLDRLFAHGPGTDTLGLDRIIRGWCPRADVEGFEWHEATVIGEGLRLTVEPTHHWGARVLHDSHRGFGGFIIEAGGRTIFHCGDTAYFDGFREIGERFDIQHEPCCDSSMWTQ